MLGTVLNTVLGLGLAAALQQGPPPRLPDERPYGGPEARLFISPMGEPFRGDDPIAAWFAQADADHDGALTETEFVADADRFFAVLDRRHDGEIDPDDIDYYETVLAPEIRTGGEPGGVGARSRGGGGGGGRRGGGGGGRRGGHGGSGGGGEEQGDSAPSGPAYDDVARGAARFGFFSYPEPVTAADANLNRGVDPTEFRNAARLRFALLDKRHDGRLTRDELPKLSPPPAGRRGERRGWYGGRHRTASDAPPSSPSPAREPRDPEE